MAQAKQEDKKVENVEDSICGLYKDPNHFEADGSLMGTRMVSNIGVYKPNITVIGTDDGVKYWTLKGEFTDKANGKLSVDFTPKGWKPVAAVYKDGCIEWEDGNKWTRVSQTKDLNSK